MAIWNPKAHLQYTLLLLIRHLQPLYSLVAPDLQYTLLLLILDLYQKRLYELSKFTIHFATINTRWSRENHNSV